MSQRNWKVGLCRWRSMAEVWPRNYVQRDKDQGRGPRQGQAEDLGGDQEEGARHHQGGGQPRGSAALVIRQNFRWEY